MKVTIVEIDIDRDPVLHRHMCRQLYKQWEENYNNLFGVYSVDELVQFYKKHRQYVPYAAMSEDGDFVGCYSLMKKGNLYWLTDVYVVDGMRSRGIGTMIVQDVLRDCPQVALNAQPDMVGFYERFGFKRGTLKAYQGVHNKKLYEYYPMYYGTEGEERSHISRMVVTIMVLVALGIAGLVWVL